MFLWLFCLCVCLSRTKHTSTVPRSFLPTKHIGRCPTGPFCQQSTQALSHRPLRPQSTQALSCCRFCPQSTQALSPLSFLPTKHTGTFPMVLFAQKTHRHCPTVLFCPQNTQLLLQRRAATRPSGPRRTCSPLRTKAKFLHKRASLCGGWRHMRRDSEGRPWTTYSSRI